MERHEVLKAMTELKLYGMRAISELDLSELQAIVPPRGSGRD